ncbi:hypothetical protein VPHD148_0261 [Vibrio phage D148]
MATYPITEVTITTPKDALKEKYEDIFESVKLIEKLSDGGFDYHAYGNSFTSMYFPIDRYIECPNCKTSYTSRKALDQNFAVWKNWQFEGECPSCAHKGTFKRRDIKSKDISRINIIKWKPDNISLNNNPITGEVEYYYKIPSDVRRKIMTGDPHFLCTVPWEMIEAVRLQRDFKFSPGTIHHMKSLSMGDFIEGFGVPPLLSHYSTVFYMQCLKKANEAIALEHMNPLRMIYPQQGSGAGDPLSMMSMGNFTGQVKNQLKKFKQDPNHVLIAPVPIGVGNMGGQGKSLLVTQELQFAEEQLLMSMGVSRELLSGTTNWTSSAVGLRLLENNMNQYVRKLKRYLKWIVKQITAYLGMEEVDVDFVPFELTDNEPMKQLYFQMQQAGLISDGTLLEAFGMDPDEEADKIIQSQIKKAETAVKLKTMVQRAEFIANRDEASDSDDDDGFGDYKKNVIATAEKILNEPDEQKRMQTLLQLQAEDNGMYEHVVQVMSNYMGDPATQGLESTAEGGVAPAGTAAQSESATADKGGA